MRPSVFVRTQYWYAEGVPAASNFHTGLLQTVWKCGAEKQPGWNCTWTPLSPSLVASLVKLKRKSSGRPHYLTVLLLKIPRKHFIIRRGDFFFPLGELILASLNESDKIRGSRNFKLFSTIFNPNFNHLHTAYVF